MSNQNKFVTMQGVDRLKTFIADTLMDLPVLIQGSYGVGKSSVVQQMFRGGNFGLTEVTASHMTPSDVQGLAFPDRESGIASKLLPDLFAKIWQSVGVDPRDADAMMQHQQDPQKMPVLFIDELGTATMAVQQTFLTILTDKSIGGRPLPNNILFIMATNTAAHGGGNRISEGLLARVAGVNWGGATSQEWIDHGTLQGLHPMVLAYIDANPSDLNEYNQRDEANPIPRQWFKLGKVLAREPSTDRVTLASAIVGTTYGAKFESFVQMYDKLATLDEVITNPDGAKLPEKEAEYMMAFSLTSLAFRFHATAMEATDYDRDEAAALQVRAATQYLARLPRDIAYMYNVRIKRQEESMPTELRAHWVEFLKANLQDFTAIESQ